MRANRRKIALALLLCLTALTLRTAYAQTAVYWGSRGELVTQVQQKLQKSVNRCADGKQTENYQRKGQSHGERSNYS